jgi:hypothetical protein
MQRRDRQNAQAAATASRHNSTETSPDRRKPPHRSPLHYHSATFFDRPALRFLTGVYTEADVVILRVSTPVLATGYITEHEIPQTLHRHKAKETVLVPVILEKCRWEKTALAKLNAHPEKGQPLNKWKPQSEGWNSVASGLATVFRRLINRKKRVTGRVAA